MRRGSFAGSALAVLLSACFGTPNYDGRLCGALDECPAGWVCASDGRCHRPIDAPDTGPGARDADAPDAPAGDATQDAALQDTGAADLGFPDAAPADVGFADALPLDSGIQVTEAQVASSEDDAMEGPPNQDTLVAYDWESLYSTDHWGARCASGCPR